MATELNDIQLNWQIDQGSPGIDSDPRNPLSRALNSPFNDGRPQRRLGLCFFGADDGEISDIGPLRWIGAFVLSSEGRIIFFPGFAFQPQWVRIARKQAPHRHCDINIDHVSLENDMHRWHFTSHGSVDHLGSGNTVDLGEGRFLWFGLSVADSSVLKEVRRETIVRAQVPASDAKRRMDCFRESREGAVFNIVSLHSDARDRFQEGFLHFAFITGPSGFPDYSGPQFGIPFGSPFLREQLPAQLTNVPFRLHRVSLGTQLDIEVIAIWLPGALTERVTVTSPSGM